MLSLTRGIEFGEWQLLNALSTSIARPEYGQGEVAEATTSKLTFRIITLEAVCISHCFLGILGSKKGRERQTHK